MNGLEIFFLVIVLVPIVMAIRLVSKRGIMGSLLGGTIEKTYGEVGLSSHGMVSHTFKIHRLIIDDSPQIAFVYRQGSFGGGKLFPLKLTKNEAKTLANLLTEATNEI